MPPTPIFVDDTELLKESECSLDILRKKAKEILISIEAIVEKSKNKADVSESNHFIDLIIPSFKTIAP